MAVRPKARGPYNDMPFSCPPGCGCPDCRTRSPRPVVAAAVSAIGVTVLVVGLYLAVRTVWALIKGQW